MRPMLFFAVLCLGGPVDAASLCGVSDPAQAIDRIAGEWTGAPRLSIDNETTAILRRGERETVVVSAGGSYTSPVTDDVMRAPARLVARQLYDVDGVDDLLDTAESGDLADLLSDTPCGPEELPQLIATVSGGEGMQAEGTVALIPYFDDRMLRLTELTLRGEGAVLFVTGATLLTPAE